MDYSKIIYDLLKNNAPVTAIIAERIGIINVLEEEPLPYIYFRQSVESEYAKPDCYHFQDTVRFQVNIVTSIKGGMDAAFGLAEKIRVALVKNVPTLIKGFQVKFIMYDGHDFQEYHKEQEAYITPLNFTMIVNTN